MSDPQQSSDALTLPPQPEGPGRLPSSPIQAVLRAGIGTVLFAAGVLCQQFSSGLVPGFEGFPGNAPVESALNLGMTVNLCGAGIALWVTALIALFWPSVTAVGRGVSALAIAGTVLVGVALFAFAFAVPGWVTILSGTRGRFDSLVFSLFLAGMPWAVGTVLATIALRNPHRSSRYLAGAAVAFGVLLAGTAVAASALYSRGITD